MKIIELTDEVKELTEMPKINKRDLPYMQSNCIPISSLESSYTFIDSFGNNEMYAFNRGNKFVIVDTVITDNQCKRLHLRLLTEDVIFPTDKVLSHINTKFKKQTRFVEVSEELANEGLATKIYTYLISNNYTLVSDSEHYNGGQALWKKIARDNNVFVAIWNTTDWLRDNDNNVICYDNININDNAIWGGNDKKTVYLVASDTMENYI